MSYKDGIPVHVPDGVSGNWRVETFTVSQADSDFTRIRSMLRPDEFVPPGTYKRLMRGGTVVMSNTPFEIRTNRAIIREAEGDVLINGLGLGMVLTAILANPKVRSVTVIEKEADVIALVGPSFRDPRVTIIHADALTYTPPKGKKWDTVWHDIWDFVCGDNLPQMKALHRKYGRRASWQGSWCRAQCERGY